MSQFITHLALSLTHAEEDQLQSQGFIKILKNLNPEDGGQHIHLWFKKESGASPITRIQISFNQEMEAGLTCAGYTKLPQNLNTTTAGSPHYMWFSMANTEHDTHIEELDVTLEPKEEGEKFSVGRHWEKLGHLHLSGKFVHVWAKRTRMTFIEEVKVSLCYDNDAKLFKEGFTRIDVNTNQGTGGAVVFIWYRKTIDVQKALTELEISTNDYEEQDLQKYSYQKVDGDLNQGTGGNKVYLWYKKGIKEPVRVMTLLPPAAVEYYESATVTVVKKNLNSGNSGQVMFMCLAKFWYEK